MVRKVGVTNCWEDRAAGWRGRKGGGRGGGGGIVAIPKAGPYGWEEP